MKSKALFASFLFVFTATQSAVAQVVPELEIDTKETSENFPVLANPSSTVPKLNITWDCGECEHNEKVVPLIEQAYTAEAKKNSYVVSETDIAEVAITDIRQRPPGVRIMFGIMAGKDRLGLRIRYLGQEHTVSDTSANIIMGLNYLSESVGKKTYAELAVKPVE